MKSRSHAPTHNTVARIAMDMESKPIRRGSLFDGMCKVYSAPFTEIDSGYLVLNQMAFCDLRVGWAAGPQQVIRSVDGGNVWTNKYGTLLQDLGVVPQSVEPVSSSMCWIAGSSFAPGVFLFRTVDGGKSWEALDIGEEVQPKCLCFVTSGIGWVLASSGSTQKIETYLFHTNDGGKSWQRQFLPQASGMPSLLRFTKEGVGYLVERRDILKPSPEWSRLYASKDGGQIWHLTAEFDCSVNALIVDDAHRIYIGDDDGIVWKSENAGRNWRHVVQLGGPVQTVVFDRRGFGFIAGDFDGALISKDGGVNWTEYSFAGLISAVIDAHFIEAKKVVIASTVGIYRLEF